MMLKDWMKRHGVDERSFHGSMLIAYSRADLSNQKRIKNAFPKVANDYEFFFNRESKRIAYLAEAECEHDDVEYEPLSSGYNDY